MLSSASNQNFLDMDDSIILKCAKLFAFAVFALLVSALIAYASTMTILIFGLVEHADYIMIGVFTVMFVYLMCSNFKYIWNHADNCKTKNSETNANHAERDYFKIGDFSPKHRY